MHDNPAGLPLWERGVTADVQAAYIVRAISLVRATYPYVGRMYWYKERTMPGDEFHEAGYRLLRADLTPRPAYAALQTLLVG